MAVGLLGSLPGTRDGTAVDDGRGTLMGTRDSTTVDDGRGTLDGTTVDDGSGTFDGTTVDDGCCERPGILDIAGHAVLLPPQSRAPIEERALLDDRVELLLPPLGYDMVDPSGIRALALPSIWQVGVLQLAMNSSVVSIVSVRMIVRRIKLRGQRPRATPRLDLLPSLRFRGFEAA